MASPTPTLQPSRLDDLARPKAGIVSRSRLLANGWSPSAITRALSRGRLCPVARGVYRTAGTPFSRRAARHAVIALLGDAAVLARHTAAELHGFAEPAGTPLEALIPAQHRRPRGVDHLVSVQRTTTAVEATLIDGLPVTTAPRTLLDLAASTPREPLTELVAAATRTRATSLSDLRTVTEEHPHATGRRNLLTILDLLGDDGTDSRSGVEVLALHAIVGAGLPRPVMAYRVRDASGRFVAEVDLAYPELGIAIEVDGFRWHSSPARKRSDEERQNRLVLAGWTVLRFSAADIRHRPDRLIAAVQAAIGATAFGG